jgi:hypothetical protein
VRKDTRKYQTSSATLKVKLRDRPFNLKRGGGYGFLFRSEFFFLTTRELEYLFFLSGKARIFFPEFNIRLYDKISESDYFFFPPPKSEYLFSNIGNQTIFSEKTHSPPSPLWKLNGPSLSWKTCVWSFCHYLDNKICLN